MTSAPSRSMVPAAEAEWIDAELARSLMASTRGVQWLALVVVLVMAGALWRHAPAPWLMLWSAAALGLSGYRIGAMQRFDAAERRGEPVSPLDFVHRHAWSWPANAAVWGLSTALFLDRTPLSTQFVAWLILAGISLFSLNSFSAHLATMTRYLHALVLSVALVIAARSAAAWPQWPPAEYAWLLILTLVMWRVLLQGGRRLHQTHRRSFELQYRNRQLIESLTRQTNAALEAVAVKNRFLASAAHDIRQPVHALGLYADWLANEPELVHELAPRIVESTKAVNQMFDSLFDLARLDAGQVTVRDESVPVADLLHDLEVQFQPLARARGLRLKVRNGAGGHLRTDPILIRRVMGNLLANAVKYTRTGGVLLAARRRHGAVWLEVWDTGVGIAPEHHEAVFREFYKAPSHAGTDDGFGLGLAIVARLSQILGHRVTLASQPGRGTRFRVTVGKSDLDGAPGRAAAMRDQLIGTSSP